MHCGNIQMLNEVLIARVAAPGSCPTPVLAAEFGQRGTLDITHMRYCDHHLIVGIEILRIEFPCCRDYLRTALVAELIPDLDELILYDLHLQRLIRQHLLKVFYQFRRPPRTLP